jgi:alpha-tubulin suppressor-like RCC1 family protein
MTACSAPVGYVTQAGDCDDSISLVHPGAPEACNGRDDNCNGIIDEGGTGGTTTYYADADHDGYGDPNVSSTTGCTAPSGYVDNARDCNDANANIHPGVADVPGNGVDENCSGADAGAVIGLSSGGMHTCALMTDLTVRCWGSNAYGQLGDGSTAQGGAFNVQASAVIGLTNVAEISAGGTGTCARKSDGSVYCWGYWPDGSLKPQPTLVLGSGATQLTSGAFHACALMTDESVRCWGSNLYGQLGDGTQVDRIVPTVVPSLSRVTQLSAGFYHTCARHSDASAHCWGMNYYGQLGDGTSGMAEGKDLNRLSPVYVTGFTGVSDFRVTEIRAGFGHTCAILDYGALTCWGENGWGQLGDGGTVDRIIPESAPVLDGYGSLSLGAAHTCAQSTSGVVACFGYNSSGQLGDGSTTDRRTPTVASALTGLGLFDISAGEEHTCGRNFAGHVYCWGKNNLGQLGDNTTTSRSTPVQVQF